MTEAMNEIAKRPAEAHHKQSTTKRNSGYAAAHSQPSDNRNINEMD